ncbi:hypothetical protein BDV96DRAFT_686873 [Lophiotrema nucula]|uniref:Large ribosomal subunit protein mL50 n=1 Tax=Lophiotrema nucula TaxID=690887 RepID=A0A6A5Z8N6_9PLEO|nr:hypothetical protein BDV96DRAFT_686873 [Lophiotrema nucula]
MRRIPRSPRSIALLSPSSSILRPSYHPPATLCLRPAPSPFSTSPKCRAGIMSSYSSQRKHQAFVRKWQKRLLGESEPIGAHVDPYDATSPVRIAPEEMGGEEEVLDEEQGVPGEDGVVRGAYVPATRGEGLERVGGKKWRAEREEEEMRELWVEVMGRDVGEPDSFDIPTKIPRDPQVLGRLFHQAVVEVYTLKEAKQELDLARYARKGRYAVPDWIYETSVHYSRKLGLELGISEAQKQELLKEIEFAPPAEEVLGEETLTEDLDEELEDPAVEQLEEVVEEVVEAKEEAKAEPEKEIKKVQKKSFDFMANRQFPRSMIKDEAAPAPIEEQVIAEPVVIEAEPEPVLEVRQPAEPAKATESEVIVETATSQPAEPAEAPEPQIAIETPSPKPKQSFETIYSRVPLTDPALKFALAKRLTTLTGHRLSDPTLHTTTTLGDLLTSLLATAKPKPATLHEALKLQHKELRAQPKKSRAQLAREGLRRKESLLDLPNVVVRGKKEGLRDREREVGRWKVVEYALAERGLDVPGEGRRGAKRIH